MKKETDYVYIKFDLDDRLEREIFKDLSKFKRGKRNYILVEFFKRYYFKKSDEDFSLLKEVERLKNDLKDREDKLLKIIENISLKSSVNLVEKEQLDNTEIGGTFINKDKIEVKQDIILPTVKKSEISLEEKMKNFYKKSSVDL
ncbi:MAG: hypothetical protein ABSG25_07140 [Bryobacteraceae bacterium]